MGHEFAQSINRFAEKYDVPIRGIIPIFIMMAESLYWDVMTEVSLSEGDVNYLIEQSCLRQKHIWEKLQIEKAGKKNAHK